MTEVGYSSQMLFHRNCSPPWRPKATPKTVQQGTSYHWSPRYPLDSRLMPSVARSIVDWAKSKNGGTPHRHLSIAVQNRLEIEVPAFSASFLTICERSCQECRNPNSRGGVCSRSHAFDEECLEKNVSNIYSLPVASTIS